MFRCAVLVVILVCRRVQPGKVERGCWPNNVVPYKITDGFSSSQVAAIRAEIGKLHAQTCVRWVDEDEFGLESQQFVRFLYVDSEDCHTTSSQFGDGLYVVYVRLHDRCFEERAIMHELLHVLGFRHEHQRADRDCYVDVDESAENDKQFEINFEDPWIDTFPYDKYSVLHYQRSDLMKSKNEPWFSRVPLGNLKGELSALDVWKIKYKFCSYPHFCSSWPWVCELLEVAEEPCTRRPVQH